MAADDKAAGMKSAYELALERLEAQGIERPKEDALSEETRRQMADERSKAEARIAELEILHRDKIAAADPGQREELEEELRRERRSIEDRRDRNLEKLRGS